MRYMTLIRNMTDEQRKEYFELDKLKLEARNKLSKAKKANKNRIIPPTSCSICESTERIEGHHEDYSKPLEIVWLCKKCHTEAHRKPNITQ